MKEKIKKYFGEILLVIGSFITTYNVFDFRYSRGCGLSLSLSDECNNPVAYYYADDTLMMIGIGVALLVIGILKIRKKGQ